MNLIQIISGGQTGGDQGGLEAGRELGIKTGGWMPKGWLTEAGPRPEFASLYGMLEHKSAKYPPRTAANVRDSDGTIWFGNTSSFGYLCTKKACEKYRKPFVTIALPQQLREFLKMWDVRVLNVAGNCESKNRGIQWTTRETILQALR
jgi:hypothetical protein